MAKKLLFQIVIVMTFLGLVGCNHVVVSPPVTNSTEVHPSSVVLLQNLNLCERSLKIANYNLVFAKQQAKNVHVLTDWGLANQALSAAQNAYQAQDYLQCVEQAKLVNSYIERSQSYIKWRNSLNL